MPVIRHARAGDVDRLAEIGLRSWQSAIAGLADGEKMRRVAEAAFLRFLFDHWLSVLLVEGEGAICGWVACENFDNAISDLWIEPQLQGRGFGGLLFAEIERRIAADGFDAATTKTHARNDRAVRFFRNHGYGVSWLSTAYAPQLDSDVAFIGLSKSLEQSPDH
ncbi:MULTISPECIES: GNAT family N-acetyltransferase [Ensifer]|uniref:GNAT family N-acetyltransferase n=1 Tax=Ensifer adhaerens TaxID=106592 RepID=A0ABY8HJU1_ENSAD|nr:MULTISPECIES: GNAT family N-acetyltransferase [Ensifer]ANK72089.1 acetyltransferase [Ensifer adhaerens]KDP74431.1 acetyltransferase [Ensifer adhaerens]KQX18855.1 acetyltransferase [Ensifer sp. Root423]KQZ45427.1 acetyltransferase [Ensifer sp. Root558]MBD9537848.1 GNAT family N-acetyltransferase [Ensifer sp. ENS04]